MGIVASGRRAVPVAKALRSLGYKKVKNGGGRDELLAFMAAAEEASH